jgi:hypothetical protein
MQFVHQTLLFLDRRGHHASIAVQFGLCFSKLTIAHLHGFHLANILLPGLYEASLNTGLLYFQLRPVFANGFWAEWFFDITATLLALFMWGSGEASWETASAELVIFCHMLLNIWYDENRLDEVSKQITPKVGSKETQVPPFPGYSEVGSKGTQVPPFPGYS